MQKPCRDPFRAQRLAFGLKLDNSSPHPAPGSGLGPILAQTSGSGHSPVSALNPAQPCQRPVTEPVTVLTHAQILFLTQVYSLVQSMPWPLD